MAQVIKINVKTMERELQKLKSAIEELRPYGGNFLSVYVEELYGMNADYIYHLQRTLENMKDTTAPNLLKELDKLYSDTAKAIEAFREEDRAQAKAIGGK